MPDSIVNEAERQVGDAKPPDCHGYFEVFTRGAAKGWAFDRSDPTRPLTLRMRIDGEVIEDVVCNVPRKDVQAIFGHKTGEVGFLASVPPTYFDNKPHRVSFEYESGEFVPFLVDGNVNTLADYHVFREKTVGLAHSSVDGVRQGMLHGWALQVDRATQKLVGGCQLLITCDGVRMAQVRADRHRGDVASNYGADPNCGFQVAIPAAFRKAHAQTFRFTTFPDLEELSNSPLVTAVADGELEAKLLRVVSEMDRLYVQFTELRKEIDGLLPKPGYNLSDYDRWARRYYENLTARTAAARAAPTQEGPLVSILVPTYKPLMSDFEAAIESVIAQTYENWELIIVDDGSKVPELTARIQEFAARDGRIRPILRKRNVGISGATNVAIDAARGKYVAFFDHDDLLVDVAIELMVDAAERRGAKMVYSDEDKIDQAGYYLEPNFKPDWNYRYVLGCNYVCHLLMVDRAVLQAVGRVDSTYDGAQDHDLILRISETIDHATIHHVPEMLYHWRKTPNSTASDISKKSYAVDAGIAAVSDHLRRMGKRAEVSSVRGLTLYRIDWTGRAQPRVSIIIPFKDEIETTRRCFDTIQSVTRYKNYDIVLIDNWSLTREAEAFCAEVRKLPNVRVLRVEEPFNYSRLNNLATQGNDAAFFMFMNNDLFVQDPDWLRVIVNEALSDKQVAIVGGKFLYPNGTIQHAGVVVGAAGIAAHVHRGSPGTDYGYIGRAMLTHELTAVTAAGMLIRADVFREVGGLDEEHLTIAFNDVDLCLKVRAAGYKVIWSAEFVAEHHESLSRGTDVTPRNEKRFFYERETMLSRWAEALSRDPHYSPHMTVDKQPFFDLLEP